eukprot:NODE_902_length_3237_cov_0.930848.p2 type:complete len:150 gc:universal NODE_902_length_3237_cov_0.930848:425-874(+)
MKQTLVIHCEIEHVKEIKADPEMILPIKLKCIQCHEDYPNLITLDPEERYPVKNSRGEANVVLSCKFCKKDANLDLLELKEYKAVDSESGEIEFEFAVIECRGCEITKFEPVGPFIINNIVADLRDDWCEVLDNGNCQSVLNLKGRIKR